MKKRIFLFASSSGGHIFPIMGLYEILKDDFDITFIGIKNRFEEKIFPKNSLFFDIPHSFKSLKDSHDKTKFISFIHEMKTLIKDEDLIISGGGFSSYIVYKLKHKNTIILEQNRIMGDANMLLGLKAKKILTNMDILFNPFFYKTKKIMSPSIFRNNIYDVKKENMIVFIFGSLSSSSLIKETILFFLSDKINNDVTYLLVAGKYINEIKKYKFKSNIKIIEKIDDINYLKKAKLVFTRAGGTSINEFLYHNIDFIMIPSPYVKHNHQEKNAKYINKIYKVPYILEKNFDYKKIHKFIEKYTGYNYYKKDNNELNYIKELINECF